MVSTTMLRKAWAEFACNEEKMLTIQFGPDEIRVAAPTIEAWKALERVLAVHRYELRIEDTDSYNCRELKGGVGKSLHAFGIALDINWSTNPYIDHEGRRAPRFSTEATQALRAHDVRIGKADTDMTRAMIAAALAIRTKAGKRVFGWGGNWETLKDAMHFQIELTPAEIGDGIDWRTVPALPAPRPAAPPMPAPGRTRGPVIAFIKLLRSIRDVARRKRLH